MSDDIMDAEVVEETGLAVQQASVTLFGTQDPELVIERSTAHATALAKVVRARNLAVNIKGREHVRVEGWTLLGSMVGVFPVTVWTKPIEGGFVARVEARTLHGQVVGAAESMCTSDENTWKGRDRYALQSMAQTRATSKALRQPLGFIMQLAGYDATPAEEMPHEADDWSAPSSGPSCLTCGSPVWDNSQDPNRGNRPKWKCKDKNCGWASWDDDPFTQNVQTDSAPPSSTSAEPHPSDEGGRATPEATAEDGNTAPKSGGDVPVPSPSGSPSSSLSETVKAVGEYIDGDDIKRSIVKAKIMAAYSGLGMTVPNALASGPDYMELEEDILRDVLHDLDEAQQAAAG